jgi:DNA-directed RNA polymerase specialized sigma24 family protein
MRLGLGIYNQANWDSSVRLESNPRPDTRVSYVMKSMFRSLAFTAGAGWGLDPRYRFVSWIYRIVVNEALNTRSRRRPATPLVANLPGRAGVEDALASRERRDFVQAALLRLSAEDREVIVLRHFAELSYAEIGETLGLTEKTVKSRLHEARQRLGRMLGAEGLQ